LVIIKKIVVNFPLEIAALVITKFALEFQARKWKWIEIVWNEL